MINGPGEFMSGGFTTTTTNSTATPDPQLTPREFQALFKMSNGNVLPQAQKFFGSYRYSLFCTVCNKRKEIEGYELESIHIEPTSGKNYLWCAMHKHLKVTAAIEASTDMPLPVLGTEVLKQRKFKEG
jgi:hypothetical protein